MKNRHFLALIDCDSFFVSCEQKANPDLKNKPICVISNPNGCVIARSKEAKKLGVKMGEPLFMASKSHPKAIYVVANHELYKSVSNEVMALLRNFSPEVQEYSIDEAFVDLTGLKKLYKMNYYALAKYIRQEIKAQIDIPVSIGISTSKVLAKLASDKAKTEDAGIYMIGNRKIIPELKQTSVEEIWGIGRNLTKLFHQAGVINAYELVQKPDEWLKSKVGINGVELKHELLGESISKVSTEYKMPKSIQQTRALSAFTSDLNTIKNALNYHIHKASSSLRKLDAKASTIGVMLRTKDFRVMSEKINLIQPTCYEWEISDIVFKLLEKIYDKNIIYRSTGVWLERFQQNSGEQLSLLSSEVDEKNVKLAKCIDNLENKFGKSIVKIGYLDK